MIKMKMYCIVSLDAVKAMQGNRGKLAAQVGHAYLHSYWDAMQRFQYDAFLYRRSQAFKIALKVDGEDQLRELDKKYMRIAGTSLVTDMARTVFKQPTVTCLGIGPLSEELIGDDLKALPLFI